MRADLLSACLLSIRVWYRWTRSPGALALLLAVVGSATASAALIVDPPRTITHEVHVQLIETARDDGSQPATMFGNPAQRADIEAGIDRIWAQAGVDIEFLSPTILYPDTFAWEGFLEPRPNSDLGQILENARLDGIIEEDSDAIHLFLVEIAPGFAFTTENTVNGLGNIGNDGIALFIGENLLSSQNGRNAVATVVAHEIGHNLGLKHPAGGLPNLMSPGGTTEQLTQAQIDAVLQQTFRNDAVAFIPSGGTGFPQMLPPGPQRTWNRDADGVWTFDQNWHPAEAPNAATESAIFGSAIRADRTITLTDNVTVNSITFDNAYSYHLAGFPTVELASQEGTARLDVSQGQHIIDADLRMTAATEIDVAAGGELELRGNIDFNGHVAHVVGAGRLLVVGDGSGNNGTLLAANGSLQGDGSLGARVVNSAGEVAPGDSVGSLLVWGDYEQGANATLAIEIAGADSAAQYDRLIVGQDAYLDGQLDVSLVAAGGADVYEPSAGDSFTLLTTLLPSASVVGQFGSVSLPPLPDIFSWDLQYQSRSVVLEVLPVATPADFNSDGEVDRADLAIWTAGFGTAGAGREQGDADFDGDVDGTDYLLWLASASTFDASAATAVPEPTSLSLFMCAQLAILLLRRRHRLASLR